MQKVDLCLLICEQKHNNWVLHYPSSNNPRILNIQHNFE